MSSGRKEKLLSLASLDYSGKSAQELQKLARATLNLGMHGLCFSPYGADQKPGDIITEHQIHQKMKLIAPYTKWIRSFSCTEGNEAIPKIAKEYGLKTLVGAWLGEDQKVNQKEMEGLIHLANQGYVDIAAVGNEVMYRGDLSEEELLYYIKKGKASITHIPVGYVDAYYEFRERPRIAELCDVILANCYPFWEGCDMDYSLMYMKDMYRQAQLAGQGKRVIVTETGWPSEGTSLEGAFPSYENYLKYFMNSQKWSKEEQIELFYFSSFDESWKVGAEGDVGAFWGLWDDKGVLKF